MGQTNWPIKNLPNETENEAKWSKLLSHTHDILKSALIHPPSPQKCKKSKVGQTNWPIENLPNETENEAKWSKLLSHTHDILKSALIYPQRAQKCKKSKVGQTNRPTDQPTNRQTDIVTCRVACTRLKTSQISQLYLKRKHEGCFFSVIYQMNIVMVLKYIMWYINLPAMADYTEIQMHSYVPERKWFYKQKTLCFRFLPQLSKVCTFEHESKA